MRTVMQQSPAWSIGSFGSIAARRQFRAAAKVGAWRSSVVARVCERPVSTESGRTARVGGGDSGPYALSGDHPLPSRTVCGSRHRGITVLPRVHSPFPDRTKERERRHHLTPVSPTRPRSDTRTSPSSEVGGVTGGDLAVPVGLRFERLAQVRSGIRANDHRRTRAALAGAPSSRARRPPPVGRAIGAVSPGDRPVVAVLVSTLG